MADLTTVETVKEWLGIDSNADDLLLSRLVSAVSVWVERYVGRTISEVDYVEHYTCWGEQRIELNQFPVISVDSVEVDGVEVDESTEYGSPGWAVDGSTLVYNGGVFSARGNRFYKNVKVTYSAGYSPIPYDLEQAVVHLVALRYRERDRIGEKSKILSGETVYFSVFDLPPDVKSILEGYRVN